MFDLTLSNDYNQIAPNLGYSRSDADITALPRIRLAQGLTPEVLEGICSAGQWLIPNQQPQSEVIGDIFGVKKQRLLWNRNTTPATIVCRSDDGEIGIGEPGGNCKECPFSQWEDGNPPVCELRYEYLIIVDQVPYVISLSTRSASKVISQLNLALRTKEKVKVALRSSLTIKGQKRYYVPVVTFVE